MENLSKIDALSDLKGFTIGVVQNSTAANTLADKMVKPGDLLRLREIIPEIERGPQYLGITNFGSRGVDIRMMAECPENVRAKVEHAQRRKIKLIFDKNHISIPFPQAVLNQPESFESGNGADKNV